jgi:hypothetical protein
MGSGSGSDVAFDSGIPADLKRVISSLAASKFAFGVIKS